MPNDEEIEKILPYASPETCAKLAKLIVKKKLKNPNRE